MNNMSPKTARAVFDLLNRASSPHSTGTAENPESATGTAATSTARAGGGKAPGTKGNAVAAVISTLATRSFQLHINELLISATFNFSLSYHCHSWCRFSKVILECGLKKEAVAISTRCGASLAISALQKMS
jgi:hypothetical protein